MSIEWLRDLIIFISGLVLIGWLVFVAVLLYSLYRRTRHILDSIRVTSRAIQGISSYVGDEVVKPVLQIVTLIQGIRQGIDAVNKFFRKKEGGKNG